VNSRTGVTYRQPLSENIVLTGGAWNADAVKGVATLLRKNFLFSFVGSVNYLLMGRMQLTYHRTGPGGGPPNGRHLADARQYIEGGFLLRSE